MDLTVKIQAKPTVGEVMALLHEISRELESRQSNSAKKKNTSKNVKSWVKIDYFTNEKYEHHPLFEVESYGPKGKSLAKKFAKMATSTWGGTIEKLERILAFVDPAFDEDIDEINKQVEYFKTLSPEELEQELERLEAESHKETEEYLARQAKQKTPFYKLNLNSGASSKYYSTRIDFQQETEYEPTELDSSALAEWSKEREEWAKQRKETEETLKANAFRLQELTKNFVLQNDGRYPGSLAELEQFASVANANEILTNPVTQEKAPVASSDMSVDVTINAADEGDMRHAGKLVFQSYFDDLGNVTGYVICAFDQDALLLGHYDDGLFYLNQDTSQPDKPQFISP